MPPFKARIMRANASARGHSLCALCLRLENARGRRSFAAAALLLLRFGKLFIITGSGVVSAPRSLKSELGVALRPDEKKDGRHGRGGDGGFWR
jgi:hypothetical protein